VEPDAPADALAARDAPVPDEPTFDELVVLVGDLYCEWAQRCLSSEPAFAFELVPCESVMAEYYEHFRPLLDEGRVAFDPAAAAALLRA
jgi:hypothetical protein